MGVLFQGDSRSNRQDFVRENSECVGDYRPSVYLILHCGMEFDLENNLGFCCIRVDSSLWILLLTALVDEFGLPSVPLCEALRR